MDSLSTKEYSRQRRAKSTTTLKLASNLLKKDGWKKCQYMLWQVVDDLFWTVWINTHLNSDTTSIEISVKPLSIDPILWDVMSLAANKAKPLSFRALGAFTCPLLLMDKIFFLNDTEQATLEHDIQRWVNGRLPQLTKAVAGKSFSTLFAQDVNQVERHAYALPIFCSLVAEQDFTAAHALATKYSSDSVMPAFNLSKKGVPFFALALAYLHNNASPGVCRPDCLRSSFPPAIISSAHASPDQV